MKVCCALLVISSMLFGQVLYEEHFTGGVTQLQWDEWVGFSVMEVINDPTTPGGDSWAGSVYNDSAPIAAMYAGDYNLDDYMVEAWIYTNVSAMLAPYNGLCIRIDTATNSLYQLVSDFDGDARLRLRHIMGATPTVIRDWTSSEIPGGIPATSSWHKFTLKMKGDSIWAYYDDSLLADCPFIDTRVPKGYFGIYFFSVMGGSTKCDDIIALGLTGINEYGSQTVNGFTAYPNPFSDRTTISYVVGSGGYQTQTMQVYDASGRLVTDLRLAPVGDGVVSVTWNGHDGLGNRVAPGVYFVRDDSGRQIEKVVKLH